VHQYQSQDDDIGKLRAQITEMEQRLVKEEADLEEVRDSLKGRPEFYSTPALVAETLDLQTKPTSLRPRSRTCSVILSLG
jgi:hypothetical protein